MKPTPHTIQWLAPHLSDGEVQALYELVVKEVIGRKDIIPFVSLKREANRRTENNLRDKQTTAAMRLFGKET